MMKPVEKWAWWIAFGGLVLSMLSVASSCWANAVLETSCKEQCVSSSYVGGGYSDRTSSCECFDNKGIRTYQRRK